ncbi:MAG: hypothetical protein ACOCSE_00220 [Chitinivibrionales bacterium]
MSTKVSRECFLILSLTLLLFSDAYPSDIKSAYNEFRNCSRYIENSASYLRKYKLLKKEIASLTQADGNKRVASYIETTEKRLTSNIRRAKNTENRIDNRLKSVSSSDCPKCLKSEVKAFCIRSENTLQKAESAYDSLRSLKKSLTRADSLYEMINNLKLRCSTSAASERLDTAKERLDNRKREPALEIIKETADQINRGRGIKERAERLKTGIEKVRRDEEMTRRKRRLTETIENHIGLCINALDKGDREQASKHLNIAEKLYNRL